MFRFFFLLWIQYDDISCKYLTHYLNMYQAESMRFKDAVYLYLLYTCINHSTMSLLVWTLFRLNV